MKTMRIALTAGTVALGLALSGCSSGTTSATPAGGTSTGGSGGNVNVLAIVDLSGASKAYGSQELAGLQAAVAYYNANGGIAGHQVAVKVLDDNGNVATATSLAVKELSTNASKYAMVYPGAEGSTIAALIPIVKRYGVYAIALDDGAAGCKSASACPTEFSLVGAPDLAEVAGAQWMKQQGYNKVGILEEQVDFTESETGPMQTSATKVGITTTKESFPASATSVTAEMSSLKSAGVDAVFAEVLGAPAGYTLAARAQLGWNVPVIFDIAGSSLDISKLVSDKSQLKNAYETVPYCSDSAHTIPAFDLLNKYAKNLEGSIPCNLSGNGWDSIVLFNDAMKAAGSTKPQALVKATESLPPSAVSDKNYIVYPMHSYTSSDHENVAQTPSTFSILPVGTIAGTRLKPLG